MFDFYTALLEATASIFDAAEDVDAPLHTYALWVEHEYNAGGREDGYGIRRAMQHVETQLAWFQRHNELIDAPVREAALAWYAAAASFLVVHYGGECEKEAGRLNATTIDVLHLLGDRYTALIVGGVAVVHARTR